MKLRKARLHAYKQLPEWAKCCPEACMGLRVITRLAVTVDIETVYHIQSECGFCKANYGPVEVVRVTDCAEQPERVGQLVAVGHLDILEKL